MSIQLCIALYMFLLFCFFLYTLIYNPNIFTSAGPVRLRPGDDDICCAGRQFRTGLRGMRVAVGNFDRRGIRWRAINRGAAGTMRPGRHHRWALSGAVFHRSLNFTIPELTDGLRRAFHIISAFIPVHPPIACASRIFVPPGVVAFPTRFHFTPACGISCSMPPNAVTDAVVFVSASHCLNDLLVSLFPSTISSKSPSLFPLSVLYSSSSRILLPPRDGVAYGGGIYAATCRRRQFLTGFSPAGDLFTPAVAALGLDQLVPPWRPQAASRLGAVPGTHTPQQRTPGSPGRLHPRRPTIFPVGDFLSAILSLFFTSPGYADINRPLPQVIWVSDPTFSSGDDPRRRRCIITHVQQPGFKRFAQSVFSALAVRPTTCQIHIAKRPVRWRRGFQRRRGIDKVALLIGFTGLGGQPSPLWSSFLCTFAPSLYHRRTAFWTTR